MVGAGLGAALVFGMLLGTMTISVTMAGGNGGPRQAGSCSPGVCQVLYTGLWTLHPP